MMDWGRFVVTKLGDTHDCHRHDRIGTAYHLRDIPDDALVSELLSRDRIRWYHTETRIGDMELHHMRDSRADYMAHTRSMMVHRLAQKLFEDNIGQTGQTREHATDSLIVRVRLPVFIRFPDTKS